MKVVALKSGFFGKLRQAGDVFEVPDGTRGSWFRPDPASSPPPPKAEPRLGGRSSKKPELQADDLV
jgi:hypothetical protein